MIPSGYMPHLVQYFSFLEEQSLIWPSHNFFIHHVTVQALQPIKAAANIGIKKRQTKNTQQKGEHQRTSDLQVDFKSNQEALATFTVLTCGPRLQAVVEHKVKPFCAFCIHQYLQEHTCVVSITQTLHIRLDLARHQSQECNWKQQEYSLQD